jgi:CBS-domain-containing membrane protein
VAQWPNVALSVFIAAALAIRIFHPAGAAGAVTRVIGVVALLAWALDELVRGVNPFRRVLGAVVLAVSVADLATRA